MPDFTSLLKAPAGTAKKPKHLPMGNYPGVVANHELVAAPPGKDYTQIVRIHVKLTGWSDTATEEDKVQEGVGGAVIRIDPTKRQLRKDFYDNSIYRLDDFMKACGISFNGESYEELLPRLIGAPITVEIGTYLDKNNDIQNQIVNLTGVK